MSEKIKCTIVGGGLAGLVCAIALRHEGCSTRLISRDFRSDDRRTTALFMPSIAFLDRLGCWQDIAAACNPLQTMRIIDGTTRLIRARPAIFHSSDIGLDCFGFNIPNHIMFEHLIAHARTLGVELIQDTVSDFQQTANGADITLSVSGKKLSADFVIAADGRSSQIRELAGIRTRSWLYQQKAIVTSFTHRLPHQNISTEFHTETGPFTQVPLPSNQPNLIGNRSSLVWAVRDGQETDYLNAPKNELNRTIEDKMHSILGQIELDSDLQVFPLSSLIADQFSKQRVLLIGEAAHAFPPIGAQGLNLGLRDVMDAVDCLKSLSEPNEVMHAYQRKRQSDIVTRTFIVDMFNRSLLTSFLPVQLARAMTLDIANNVTPVKQFLMRQGASLSKLQA